jgi:hypothetical protein
MDENPNQMLVETRNPIPIKWIDQNAKMMRMFSIVMVASF